MNAAKYEITPKLLDALYVEAMILADEARSYFDRGPVAGALSPMASVAFSCESLKVTTRLMHSIAWLLNQKAVRAGEISAADMDSEARQLGYAPASDPFLTGQFPDDAREIVRTSEDLYYRLQRISEGLRSQYQSPPEPIRLREKIMQAF